MTAFEDWTRERVADGVLVAHPAGEQRGLVRIRRRATPRTLSAVLAEIAARSPLRLRGPGRVDARYIITHEGEYATIAVLRDTLLDGAPVERHVAILDGDGVTIELEGVARTRTDAFAHDFEVLVGCLVSGAAPDRRRMYMYEPPIGWRGLRRSLSTLWVPPCTPRDVSWIEVHDALPVSDRGGAFVHDLIRVRGDCEHVAFVHDLLVGTCSSSGVALLDARFRYEVDIHDPRGEHRDTFDTLVRSIRPLPISSIVDTTALEAFGWVL